MNCSIVPLADSPDLLCTEPCCNVSARACVYAEYGDEMTQSWLHYFLTADDQAQRRRTFTSFEHKPSGKARQPELRASRLVVLVSDRYPPQAFSAKSARGCASTGLACPQPQAGGSL